MPNSSILRRILRVQAEAEPYAFPDAGELQVSEPEAAPAAAEEPAAEAAREEAPEAYEAQTDAAKTPIDFAELEAKMILRDARKQAEEILEQAREDAKRQAQEIFRQAQEEGGQAGYADGLARAEQENEAHRQSQAAQMGAEVQQFLERASASLDGMMDRSVDDLRDLAIAIAEKVVRVSLKSSGEVIARMIQAAVDKHKRREWVHIYIADCDAKRMVQIPRQLSAALSALSSRVRIIPMVDDESGTCIVETPDEIIDASASTQLANIKNLLSDTPPVDDDTEFRVTF